jgi:murein DD-endopeptidase MepM/ murein hydrolase activator NlpD
MSWLAIVQSALLSAALGAPWRGTAPGIEQRPARRSALIVSWAPAKIDNGSPCLFRVKSPRPLKSLKGHWQRREIFFDFDARDGTWYGFGGVGIDAAPGRHTLMLEARLANGALRSSAHPVTVGRADYPTIALSVPRQFTEPDAETLARINEEQAFKGEVFKRITPSRLWSGSFAAPVDSVITDEFGKRRTFNGRVQSVHQGLDLRADAGTPVAAMNNGEVIVAREMFYEGGFVVIDHGQGLLTLYLHLSEIRVREGDSVTKGQIIALSGGTGRTTGPHLHVGIRWQGVYVDPALLLKMQLP